MTSLLQPFHTSSASEHPFVTEENPSNQPTINQTISTNPFGTGHPVHSTIKMVEPPQPNVLRSIIQGAQHDALSSFYDRPHQRKSLLRLQCTQIHAYLHKSLSDEPLPHHTAIDQTSSLYGNRILVLLHEEPAPSDLFLRAKISKLARFNEEMLRNNGMSHSVFTQIRNFLSLHPTNRIAIAEYQSQSLKSKENYAQRLKLQQIKKYSQRRAKFQRKQRLRRQAARRPINGNLSRNQDNIIRSDDQSNVSQKKLSPPPKPINVCVIKNFSASSFITTMDGDCTGHQLDEKLKYMTPNVVAVCYETADRHWYPLPPNTPIYELSNHNQLRVCLYKNFSAGGGGERNNSNNENNNNNANNNDNNNSNNDDNDSQIAQSQQQQQRLRQWSPDP